MGSFVLVPRDEPPSGTSDKEMAFEAIRDLIALLTNPDLFLLHINDVKMVMEKGGATEIGTAEANGADRARAATEAALRRTMLSSPMRRASRVLILISCNRDLTIGEFDTVASTVKELATEDAMVAVGVMENPIFGHGVRVTVFAACLEQCAYKEGSA